MLTESLDQSKKASCSVSRLTESSCSALTGSGLGSARCFSFLTASRWRATSAKAGFLSSGVPSPGPTLPRDWRQMCQESVVCRQDGIRFNRGRSPVRV